MFTRGFQAGVIDQQGLAVTDFPKIFDEPRSLALLNTKTGQSNPIRQLPEYGVKQYGRFLLTRLNIKDKKDTKDEDVVSQFALSDEEKAENKLQSNVTFELKDWIQDKVIWTRDFPGDVPRFSFDAYSGRLIFYWSLGSEEGKAKLKENPALKVQAEALGNKNDDYIVEVIDAFQKKTVGMFPLETGKGSFGIGSGQSEGDWLMLHDSEGRVLFYSLKDGQLRHRFFGDMAAINPRGNQVFIQNLPGEISLYSLETGNRLAKLEINGEAVFIRFNLNGDKLFILNDVQTAYVFDLNKIPRTEDRLAIMENSRESSNQ